MIFYSNPKSIKNGINGIAPANTVNANFFKKWTIKLIHTF